MTKVEYMHHISKIREIGMHLCVCAIGSVSCFIIGGYFHSQKRKNIRLHILYLLESTMHIKVP